MTDQTQDTETEALWAQVFAHIANWSHARNKQPVRDALTELRTRLAKTEQERDRAVADSRTRCTVCRHKWSQHDPEDGRCDAHSDEPGRFGPCRCGRDLAPWQAHNSANSRHALSALTEEQEG